MDHEHFVREQHELNHAMLIVGQCGIPACAEGDPGVGKTATMRALAEATQRQFMSYELSRTEPEDLQGFPVVSEYEFEKVMYKYMQFVPDERLLKAQLHLSVLLLDEVTNVGAARQAPALNLVSHGLPNAWMFMCCNPIENAADGHPLTCPFINRIWYGQWQTDIEAQDWGLTHQCQYPAPEVPLVPANYMDHQPYWGHLVCDYLRYHPEHRNACPKKDTERSKPWPSSRSWEHITRALAGASAVGASADVRYAIIQGLIGERTGVSFQMYLSQLDLPKPEWVLDNANTYKWPQRYDVVLAIITCLVAHLRTTTDPAAFGQAFVLLETLEKRNQEMASIFRGGLRLVNPKAIAEDDRKRLAAI